MGQVSKFMKNKKGIENFGMSEPEYLISVMNRHSDWCTIVCLIGGGQEINTGEAGVSEWISSIKEHFSQWDIYYSNKIESEKSTYLHDDNLLNWLKKNGIIKTDLHLAVSARSFRSEKVSEFVKNILENKPCSANEIYRKINIVYPILLTRDINAAKEWLKNKAKGTERIGIIASSGAKRLRTEGINVKNQTDPANWFLNDKRDVRSSYYLEDVATEFEIQGLEIDYTCLAWDINLYFDGNWNFQNFRGTNRENINQQSARNYLLNSYRVLLTRARQGMVIYVPKGNDEDWTRPKEKYDSTFEYLKSCGIKELNSTIC